MTNGKMPFSCSRAMSHELRSAIAMLILGNNQPEDARVDQMIAYSHSAGYSLDNLWVAKASGNDTILAALLVIPMPGRSGMIFLSPTASTQQQQILQTLLQAMLATLTAEGKPEILIYQSLLDPSQTRENQALLEVGFAPLASLAYMHKRLPYMEAIPEMPCALRNIEVHKFSDQTRSLFEQAIMASYEDTLDCPGLLGIRDIDDIIQGHQATGVFDPNLWHVFIDRGKPIAVLLITKLGKQQAAELVYFGLAVSHRGQGIAKPILQWGMELAACEAQRKLMLAVDQNNEPALKLYRSLGFVQTGIKNALIYTEKTGK